jgi:Flp pilus assembly pilin Flp
MPCLVSLIAFSKSPPVSLLTRALPVTVAGEDVLWGLAVRVLSGETRGMPGLPRRSSSDTGNSVARCQSSDPPAIVTSADSASKVVNVARHSMRVGAGSTVALSTAAAHGGAQIAQKEKQMKKLIAHLVWDDQGQDLIEYVLIGSFVSIAVLVAATLLGTNLRTWYNNVALWVGGAAAAVPAP